MAAHRLEVRGDDGARCNYNGAIGNMQFTGGLSVDLWDVDHWHVRRLLSNLDGGGNLYPRLRIARPTEPTEPPPQPPAPPPMDTPAAEAEPPTDNDAEAKHKAWGKKMAERRDAKRKAKQEAT